MNAPELTSVHIICHIYILSNLHSRHFLGITLTYKNIPSDIFLNWNVRLISRNLFWASPSTVNGQRSTCRTRNSRGLCWSGHILQQLVACSTPLVYQKNTLGFQPLKNSKQLHFSHLKPQRIYTIHGVTPQRKGRDLSSRPFPQTAPAHGTPPRGTCTFKASETCEFFPSQSRGKGTGMFMEVSQSR